VRPGGSHRIGTPPEAAGFNWRGSPRRSILSNRVSSIEEGARMAQAEKYPVLAFNEATTGPVLSHAEEIDALRAEHPFVRSTHGDGFWVFTDADLIRDALQHPGVFSSTVVTVHDPDPPYKWIPEMLDPPEHTVWPGGSGARALCFAAAGDRWDRAL
jgi:hypothetical protein